MIIRMNKAQSFAANTLDAIYAKYGVVGLDKLSEIASRDDLNKARYCAEVIWGKSDIAA